MYFDLALYSMWSYFYFLSCNLTSFFAVLGALHWRYSPADIYGTALPWCPVLVLQVDAVVPARMRDILKAARKGRAKKQRGLTLARATLKKAILQ